VKVKNKSIKEIIADIQSNRLFLPPIQRDFVWDKKRMIHIFDSIYRGYPINNFVLWKLLPSTAKKYPLHHFVKTYTEKIYLKKEPAPHNLLQKEVWAVVDGQQRLNSLYIGLSGEYKFKKGKKRNVESSLIPSRLYFNLMATAAGKNEENLFNYYSDEEAANHALDDISFEVGRVLTWENADKEINKAYRELLLEIKNTNRKTIIDKFESRENIIKGHLRRLFDMVNELAINYLEINEQNLDEVVEIFIRINSGGLVLKKSALLFSTLIASWLEGEDEINGMVEGLIDGGLDIDKDFIMRTCIVLSDLPIKYRLESFNKKNTAKIIQNWPIIKNSLNKLVDILPNIGYSHQSNLSENALIPILYYIKNGGSIKSAKALNNLKLYYVVSQVNEIFGGQGDQVLEKVRGEFIRQLKTGNTLNFKGLSELKLPGGKSFAFNEEKINEIINETYYGSPHAYFILSLLYPNIDLKTKRYDVDHIHPRSKFNRTNLIANGIIDEHTIKIWLDDKKDILSNLQLMAPVDNNSKRGKTFIDYVSNVKPFSIRKQLLSENILPVWKNKRMLELKNYDSFIDWRSKQIFKRLKTIFRV
jgi:uncharacterized protein with ParB-like and HNH nuclease domain